MLALFLDFGSAMVSVNAFRELDNSYLYHPLGSAVVHKIVSQVRMCNKSLGINCSTRYILVLSMVYVFCNVYRVGSWEVFMRGGKIQKAIIGPPAKHHLNGVSLACR